MKKTLISEQKCVLTFRRYSDGTQNLEICNEGMNQMELLGAAKTLENDTLKEQGNSYTHDPVKREVIEEGIKKAVFKRIDQLEQENSEPYHRPGIYQSILAKQKLDEIKDQAERLLHLLNLCKI